MRPQKAIVIGISPTTETLLYPRPTKLEGGGGGGGGGGGVLGIHLVRLSVCL